MFNGKESKMKSITFINLSGISFNYFPTPANKTIPDWYKKIEGYIGGKKTTNGEAKTNATIKKCIPVYDAITGGYIIYTPVDIFVSQKDDAPYYEWPSLDAIQFHPIEQAPNHPNNNGFSYPKFMNPWGVKTSKGYSTLFIQPLHRESVFTILPGIVDTDNYFVPVNFPFVLNDPTFEGLIPAGTPMAQLIPIKREKWKMINANKDLENESKQIINSLNLTFFDRYKNKYWNRKDYK